MGWDYKLDLTFSFKEFLENQYPIDVRGMETVKDPVGLSLENKLIRIKLHTLVDSIFFTCETSSSSLNTA